MRPRIYGTEVEHASGLRTPEGSWVHISSVYPTRDIIGALRRLGFVESDIKPSGAWAPNAGLFYIDRSDVAEYASPECKSVRDAVKHTKAGEVIVDRALRKLLEYEDGEPCVYRNNVDFQKNTKNKPLYARTIGFHENYMLNYKFDPNKPPIEMRAHMVPFLITRQILDGSGRFDEKLNFAISQRAIVLEKEYGSDTTKDRPILATKTKPYVEKKKNGSDATVLQLILGDTNIMEDALFLKLGTTALMLSMLEDGWTVFDQLCSNPVQAVKRIAYDDTMTEPLVAFYGQKRKLSALEIQGICAEKAEEYLRSVEPANTEEEHALAEGWEVLELWQDVLDIFECGDTRKRQLLVGSIDHVTKRFYTEHLFARKGDKTKPEKLKRARDFELDYHCITKRDLQDVIRRRQPGRFTMDNEEIIEATTLAPQDTRARQRARYIDFLRSEDVFCQTQIQWVRITVDGDKICWIKNPYDCSLQKIEDLISTIRQISAETLKPYVA